MGISLLIGFKRASDIKSGAFFWRFYLTKPGEEQRLIHRKLELFYNGTAKNTAFKKTFESVFGNSVELISVGFKIKNHFPTPKGCFKIHSYYDDD